MYFWFGWVALLVLIGLLMAAAEMARATRFRLRLPIVYTLAFAMALGMMALLFLGVNPGSDTPSDAAIRFAAFFLLPIVAPVLLPVAKSFGRRVQSTTAPGDESLHGFLGSITERMPDPENPPDARIGAATAQVQVVQRRDEILLALPVRRSVGDIIMGAFLMLPAAIHLIRSLIIIVSAALTPNGGILVAASALGFLLGLLANIPLLLLACFGAYRIWGHDDVTVERHRITLRRGVRSSHIYWSSTGITSLSTARAEKDPAGRWHIVVSPGQPSVGGARIFRFGAGSLLQHGAETLADVVNRFLHPSVDPSIPIPAQSAEPAD